MFPPPLGAWDGLRYFIVALPGPAYHIIIMERSKYGKEQKSYHRLL